MAIMDFAPFRTSGMSARTFAVVLSLAMLACGESDESTSPTSPPDSTTAVVRRIRGRNGAANRFARFSAGMRERRRRNAHASELAQLCRHSPPGGASRSVRNHVRRRSRQYPRFFPSERSERVRRESDRRCHSECVRERHQVDTEHDDSGQWRRARLCVHRCAQRDGQSVGRASRTD
jgi:hypothetical protein